jgi:nitroimidazol reductase NimA-like FMN-containing flavoprotein (pyridoxamine 5'-phosphate oxidase superfamily)
MDLDLTFTTLDRAACEALLQAHHVGRMAFSFRDRVDIEPLHYVFHDGWLYGRTRDGTKLHTLAHNPWVAFEVDEVSALFEWKSVVVHGRIEFPDPSQHEVDAARHQQAVDAFRTVVADAFGNNDPTPERDLVWALPLHTVEGRMASRGNRS